MYCEQHVAALNPESKHTCPTYRQRIIPSVEQPQTVLGTLKESTSVCRGLMMMMKRDSNSYKRAKTSFFSFNECLKRLSISLSLKAFQDMQSLNFLFYTGPKCYPLTSSFSLKNAISAMNAYRAGIGLDLKLYYSTLLY